jgi:hypothetical protein
MRPVCKALTWFECASSEADGAGRRLMPKWIFRKGGCEGSFKQPNLFRLASQPKGNL